MNEPGEPNKISNHSGSNGFSGAVAWSRANPLDAFLVAAIAGALIYFFGFVKLFSTWTLSTWVWGWQAWNTEANLEHVRLLPFIVAFVVWLDRKKIAAAKVGTSRWGWLFIAIGIFLFVVSGRTLQARLAIGAIPFLIFGIVLYVWGKEVARALLFPIAFLFFMEPLQFLTQATVRLQLFETAFASKISNLLGIAVHNVGAIITAANDSFRFTVDEGCSGVRSLMAIAMLSAIYGHFTQDRLWKKLAIFAGALVFAVIGNAGRLVSIIVVAKLFGQDLAGGPYHIVSGYLSFPFALGAMVLFGKLLNIRRKEATEPRSGVST